VRFTPEDHSSRSTNFAPEQASDSIDKEALDVSSVGVADKQSEQSQKPSDD